MQNNIQCNNPFIVDRSLLFSYKLFFLSFFLLIYILKLIRSLIRFLRIDDINSFNRNTFKIRMILIDQVKGQILKTPPTSELLSENLTFLSRNFARTILEEPCVGATL